MSTEHEHIPTAELHAYLDGELSAAEQTALHAHLATCTPCQAEFDALTALFARIDSLEDVQLAVDLRAAVLAELQPHAQPAPLAARPYRLAVIAPALLAVLALLVGWPLIQLLVSGLLAAAPVAALAPFSGRDSLLTEFITLSASLQQSALASLDALTTLDLAFPTLDASLPFALPLPLLIVLGILALAAWLGGNALLLRGVHLSTDPKEVA